MSLIHDALKKVEEKKESAPPASKAPLGPGLTSFKEPVIKPSRKMPTRTVLLGTGVAVAIGIFVYITFFSKGTATAPVPQLPVAQAPQYTKADVGQLKKRALDAARTGDMAVAWTQISAASGVAPDDPEVWNNLGYVAAKRGDNVKARQAYQKALELKPDYPEALNNLGVLEMDSGDMVKAKELFEKAVGITPAYPEANFHLGLLYERSGNKQKAAEYYRRFLEVGGDFQSSVIDQVRNHIMELERQ